MTVFTTQKMFTIKDLVTFTEEILNGKLNFKCSASKMILSFSIDVICLSCTKEKDCLCKKSLRLPFFIKISIVFFFFIWRNSETQ